MVDSSVGGKVGVDLPQGKNLVGAFKQPEMVLIDPDVLATLPDDEWRNGMAEVLKHGLLADEGLLDPTLHNREGAGELVTRAVRVKVDVVQRDPFEQGERAHLNLGHTFGHAIEQATGYQWAHGEGVGFGLLAAVTLSHRLGLCDMALVDRVDDVLMRAGLPRRTDGLDPDAIWAAMATDKKWRGGRSRFVLLRGVGGPLIMEDVARSDVVDVLNSLR
jgi:3-dehydroquinate synthetase